MTTTTTPPAHTATSLTAPALTTGDQLRWNEPAGIPARGTVVVLTGRGETSEVYQRFGHRIASDAYRVVVVPTDFASEGAGIPTSSVDPAVEAILADPATVRPVVLVGSDAGALHARRLADLHPSDVAGIVLAGVPVAPRGTTADVDREIAARTACPNHRKVLSTAIRSALFATPLPLTELGPNGAPQEHVALPVLAIHGEADELSPLAHALAVHATLGTPEVTVVIGGLHDILNDLTHRTVAAAVVTFLERVRVDPTAAPLTRTVAVPAPAAEAPSTSGTPTS